MYVQSVADLTPKYYFLDLEVQDVPKLQGEPLHCITQIAILDPSRAKGNKIFNAYINPPKELRTKATERKYTENNSAPQRLPFKKVWPDAVKWVNQGLDGNRKAIIIMHNGFKHDWPILKNEVARALTKTNIGIPKFWKPFDTLFLKNVLHIPGDGSLSGICHTLGAKVRQAHDAVEDVKMTRGIFKKMVGAASLKKVLVAALDEAHPIQTVAAVINAVATVKFVVFDFESTGLFPNKGERGENPRVVQLAGYLPSADKVFDELVNPQMSIPRVCSGIHGIYDKDVNEAASFKAVWLRFEDFMQSDLGKMANSVTVLAGHNIWGYDIKLYEAECERVGLAKHRWKSIDTLWLAKTVFKGIKGIPKRGFFKQEYLAPLLGINIVGAHDAKNDVIASWNLLKVMTEGVNETKLNQAVLSGHPILGVGQLCADEGTFSGKFFWELYNKACGMIVDFAHILFNGIINDSFFELQNLAAILNIRVDVDDSELYTSWRTFLLLTEGVDRKAVNEALQTAKPLESLLKLSNQSGTFSAQSCLERNKKACECALPLAQALFPLVKDDRFFEIEKLSTLLKVNLHDMASSVFDLKRIFLKLTAGIPQKELDLAFASKDFIKELAALVIEKGTFDPNDYVKQKNLVHPLPTIKKEKDKDNVNDFFSTSSKTTKSLKRQYTEVSEVKKSPSLSEMNVEDLLDENDSSSHKKRKSESGAYPNFS